MSQPYIGEIRMFAGNFAPVGWAFCAGQLVPISENDTLFNLIGTIYGGDGQSTFGLPDLRGRLPLHMGTSAGSTYVIGQASGSESVTLTTQQIPIHNHIVQISNSAGNSAKATNSTTLSSQGPQPNSAPVYQPYSGANQVTLAQQTIGQSGGNQPHENMQPYLCISFIISLYGVYPTQN